MLQAIIQALRQPLMAWVSGIIMGTAATVSVVQAPSSGAPLNYSNVVAKVRVAQENADCKIQCTDTLAKCLSEAGDDAEKVLACKRSAEDCNKKCDAQSLPVEPQKTSPPPSEPASSAPKDPACLLKCKEDHSRCDSRATDEAAVIKCEEQLTSCNKSCPSASSGSSGGERNFGSQNGERGGFPGEHVGQPGGAGSEEQFQKQQEEQERRQLEQAKRGFKQFVRQINFIKHRVNKVRAKNIPIPDEVNVALDVLESAKARIDGISSFEDMQILGEELQKAVEIINERIGDLERLAEYAKIRKQAQNQLTRLESQLRRLTARADAAKVDVDSLVAEINQLLDEIKSALASADAARDAGDADAAFEALEDGVFERIDEINEKFSAFEMVVRAPRELARVARELKQMELLVRRLERQKKSVTTLRELLSQMQAKFAEAKAIVATKPIPVDDLIFIVEEYEDLRDQFIDESNELQGIEEELVPEGPELRLPSTIPTKRPSESPIEE